MWRVNLRHSPCLSVSSTGCFWFCRRTCNGPCMPYVPPVRPCTFRAANWRSAQAITRGDGKAFLELRFKKDLAVNKWHTGRRYTVVLLEDVAGAQGVRCLPCNQPVPLGYETNTTGTPLTA